MTNVDLYECSRVCLDGVLFPLNQWVLFFWLYQYSVLLNVILQQFESIFIIGAIKRIIKDFRLCFIHSDKTVTHFSSSFFILFSYALPVPFSYLTLPLAFPHSYFYYFRFSAIFFDWTIHVFDNLFLSIKCSNCVEWGMRMKKRATIE